MEHRPTVILLCSETLDSDAVAHILAEKNIEVVVENDPLSALEEMRGLICDMAIAESQLDEGSGLEFLAESRKWLPNMQRVILQTGPIAMPLEEVINKVAPSALFHDDIDADRIAEMLRVQHAAEESLEEDSENLRIAEMANALNRMIDDEEIELPVLPEIAGQVERLLEDEQNSFQKVAEWVEREQSMASRILQVANSPLYATREKIYNLDQAVGRLGLRETRQILQAVIAENLFRTEVPNFQEAVRNLWLHSVCTAYGNERIAQFLKIPHSEDFFMAGLLHDIGKLLVIHLLNEGVKRDLWPIKAIDDGLLRSLMVKRHNVMGLRLLRHWEYPRVMQHAVRYHNSERFIERGHELVVITYFSNQVAHEMGYGFVPTVEKPLSRWHLASALNMTREEDLEPLEKALDNTIQRIKQSCFM